MCRDVEFTSYLGRLRVRKSCATFDVEKKFHPEEGSLVSYAQIYPGHIPEYTGVY